MKQRRVWLATTLCLALGACSLAPTYQRPASPVPAEYPGAAAQDTAASLPPWRDFFRDQRLQALIGLALDNNRDLRVAVQRVEQARAQFGIAQSDRLPTLGIQGTGQATRTPENMRQNGPDSPSVSRSYVAGVGMTSFELDFFGRVRNLSEAAYQQYLSTEEARRTVQLALIAQTAEAYFNLRTAQAMHDLMDKTLQARQGTLDLVQARFKAGVASDLDLAQAEGQVDSVKADRIAAERAIAQANNALQLLLGTPIPADLPAAAPFGAGQLAASLPAGLPSQLLERRPDIMGAEHDLKGADAQIGAARAAFFPRITLTGLLGFASPELGALFGGSHRYWQYSPQIQMPIFSGGVKGNLDYAKASQKIAVASYEKAIQTAFREVADGLAGEATYSRQLDALRSTEAAAVRSVNLAQLRYETGVDSFLQIQSAQVTLYGVQQQFIQAGASALANRVELYKALGGGWDPQDVKESENES
ncbi:Multidrug efflux system outer membrane protein OS=Castellaniella defragrans OX=75697 GN=HNR28_002360 PE=3 SV=1 [Castellaniella defragrans]